MSLIPFKNTKHQNYLNIYIIEGKNGRACLVNHTVYNKYINSMRFQLLHETITMVYHRVIGVILFFTLSVRVRFDGSPISIILYVYAFDW